MKATTNRFISILFALILSAHAHSQPTGTPVVIGEQLTIESQVLNEERSLIIGLPASYGTGNRSYPVLYVLDGSTHFHYTTGITQFLAQNQFIPEMIVVAINNTDRTRDLTPPSEEAMEQEFMPTHGGAGNFQRFFAEDLMPWVEENYRTHPYKVLIGHSFGGLFAIHTLTTRPDLFDAYIAISPSMQWNGQRLVDQAEAFFKETPELPISLYMTVGNEGGPLLGGTRKLAGVLGESTPEGLLWQFDHLPLETHGTVPHRSTYQGLEFVFANWTLREPERVYQQYGLDAIERFHAFGDERYRTERGIPALTFEFLLGGMGERGEIDEAVTLMSHPSAIENARSPLHSHLANILRQNGREADAIGFYRNAVQLNPGNEAARTALDELDVDYSDLVPEPVIDSRTLERYAGVYTSSEANDITVLLEDGQLHRELDGNRSQLFALSDTEFYMMGPDVRYRFIDNGESAHPSIHIRSGNIEFVAQRRSED